METSLPRLDAEESVLDWDGAPDDSDELSPSIPTDEGEVGFLSIRNADEEVIRESHQAISERAWRALSRRML